MPSIVFVIPLVSVCLCVSSPVMHRATASPAIVRLAAAIDVPERSAEDRLLSAADLIEAAVLAGGNTNPDAISRAEERLARFCQCATRPPQAGSEEQVRGHAAYLFRRMHRELLTGPYKRQCYQLERSLEGGPYNCVTSTILYICICRHIGIRAVAVARAHHVYCRILGPAPFDVQTTCPEWFSQALPASSQRDAGQQETHVRTLSDAQLLAKVHYNRAVVLLEDTRFSAAVWQLSEASRLDPQDGAAQQNLVAAWNNWSLQLCDSARFEEASEKILKGLQLAPENPTLLANDVYVHQQWALTLCAEHQYAEALQVLGDCHHRRPEVELFGRGRWFVYGEWTRWLADQGRSAEAVSILNRALAQHPGCRELAEQLGGLLADQNAKPNGV